MKRKIVPIQLAPVPIFGRDREVSKISSIPSHKASNLDAQQHATIQVTKNLTIPDETEFPVIL